MALILLGGNFGMAARYLWVSQDMCDTIMTLTK